MTEEFSMLKGVNKLIIEVSNPESDFFERAIFFVKPGKSDMVTRDLNKSVSRIINKADSAAGAGKIRDKGTGAKIRNLLMFAGAAGAGAAIAVITGELLKLSI
ncbi:MAG: hypothetical protein FWG70_00265 [Oscillospiraceae bacterium]|nr:hypothetical protein [Oscillospiraceae bacterium]